jgi:hypothetical protein
MDPTGLATTCDKEYCTVTADNAKNTSGRTIVAAADLKAGVNVNAQAEPNTLGVPGGNSEKLAAVERTGDGTVQVQAMETKNGQTSTGTTAGAKDPYPSDTVAIAHGHIDGGGHSSNGMVDDPASNGGLGDGSGLKAGVPVATVSHGQVGWHEMKDGRLQFSAPVGAMTPKQMDQMQRNLNVEQTHFQ